jgi:DNA-binding PadR family transcriptional regulator
VGERDDPKPATELHLTPAMFHILLALADGERHGYAIVQETALRTDGAVRIGLGTMYRSIKQLLAAGLIVESDERPDPSLDDERRRYYRLTEQGFRAAAAEARRWEQVVRLARSKQLLSGEVRFATEDSR